MIFKGLWFILAVVCLFLAAFIDLSKKYILDKNIESFERKIKIGSQFRSR